MMRLLLLLIIAATVTAEGFLVLPIPEADYEKAWTHALVQNYWYDLGHRDQIVDDLFSITATYKGDTVAVPGWGASFITPAWVQRLRDDYGVEGAFYLPRSDTSLIRIHRSPLE